MSVVEFSNDEMIRAARSLVCGSASPANPASTAAT
jgi:hypothetical protein